MKKGLIIGLIVVIVIVAVFGYFFFIKEKLEEEEITKTEIRMKGTGTEMVIFPSKGREISDIVTLKMEKVPEDTKSVLFSIYPGSPRMGANISFIGFDKDGADGWLTDFDTYSYENGIYTIEGHTFNTKEPGEGIQETTATRVQVTIKSLIAE